MITIVYLENFRSNFCVLFAESKLYFGGDEEAEDFMKATEIELRLFSDKNYPGFVKTFALHYYVVGGY